MSSSLTIIRSNSSSSSKGKIPKTNSTNSHDQLRRGPWTLEEDNLLNQYITCHGEGKWNSLAKLAGLNRTGKSCRLRWLNYLKPDIKRGNLTPQEQLLILEFHSKWGNRWSKIAQHLPGRTDNEIKNYWRTRVQKQARQLKVDSNSTKFLEAIRMYWMPRLQEKMEQNSSISSSSPSSSVTQNFTAPSEVTIYQDTLPLPCPNVEVSNNADSSLEIPKISGILIPPGAESCGKTFGVISAETDCYHVDINPSYDMQELESGDISLSDSQVAESDWLLEDLGSSFWNSDELWQFRKAEEYQLNWSSCLDRV